MARYFIVGGADEDGYWLIDTQQMTVQPLDQIEGSTLAQSDVLSALGETRRGNTPFTRGVAVAIATEERPSVPSHELFAPRGTLASHELFIDHPV